MAKTTVLLVCLIGICIEFQEISACLHEKAPCEKVWSCRTHADCNGGKCVGISTECVISFRRYISRHTDHIYLF